MVSYHWALALAFTQFAEELCPTWVSLPTKVRQGINPFIAHNNNMTVNVFLEGLC